MEERTILFSIQENLQEQARENTYADQLEGSFYDYTACGFLSVWERSPYGGQVHCRPEILWDIDNLLRLDLSGEWELSVTTAAHESTSHWLISCDAVLL